MSLADELFEVAFGRAWDGRAIERFRAGIERADSMGMRAGVFAKVGDSNLATYNSLYGLGFLDPIWDEHEWLEPTMERYRNVELPAGDPLPERPLPGDAPSNSFSRYSAATRSMIKTDHLLGPVSQFSDGPLGWLPDSRCRPDDSMLRYEIELIKPRFVLLNVGSNEAKYGFSGRQTGKRIGKLIKRIKRLGPVPVVFTIPPQLDRGVVHGRWKFAEETGKSTRSVARKTKVPVFDQWQMLADERLIHHGMVELDTGHFDGLHLETVGGFRETDALKRSIDFSPEALLYGANLRNLLILRLLHELDSVMPIES